ncbi:hypothetical protein SUGI_0804230 [Cryptomeria japonica]|uniref:putative Myb family transcription factor At1g14600 n=1 Tax=Cryptomeria japonica TaxID=3369 RepID=UPI0024147F02|nr:putative Myb family transcription factor At1g14600 [Cryptomeria japonica]GLJ39382.1 hypothetical protein SUGI_0804230 [Cryptomeria japonica]
MRSLEGKTLVRQYVRSAIPGFRWTHELHQSFLRAIECLGGEHEATPKLIVGLMGVNGLTVSQVKSHLQMHRNNKKHEKSQEVKSRNSHLQRFEDRRERFRLKYSNSPFSSLSKKSHKYISLYSHKRLRASEAPSSLADEKDPQRVLTSSEQNRTFGSYVHCSNSISALLTSTHQYAYQDAHDIIWNIKLSQAWPENEKYYKNLDLDSMPRSKYSKDGEGEASHSELQLQLDHKLWYHHGEFASSIACRGHNKQESKDSEAAMVLNSIQLANSIAWRDDSKGQDVDNVKLNQKPLLLEDDIQLELSLSIP